MRASPPRDRDADAGSLAGVIFAATLVFFILQVPVWIAVATVWIVLPSLGLLSDAWARRLMAPTAIVLDSALVAGIVVWARRQLRAEEDGRDEPGAPPCVSERTLETAVLVTVLATIAWVRLLGLTAMGMHIAVHGCSASRIALTWGYLAWISQG